MQQEQELTTAAQAAIVTAYNLVISDETGMAVAAQVMSGFKTAKQSIGDFFKPMKDSAFKAHKEICAREKTLLAPYEEADKAIKIKVNAYAAEQRRLAEIEASRIRAEQEAEAKRLMEEAVKAESVGNEVAAQSFLKQASITETVKTPVMQVSKTDGISYRTTYNIFVEDLSKIPCEINGVTIRPVDESAVKKLAQISKGTISIPGIKIVTNKEAYSR